MEKKIKECPKQNTEKIKKEPEDYQKKSEEYLAGWQRSRADFLNYKKEEVKRIQELLKYVNEDLILKILPVLDNFEKAEKEIPQEKKDEYLGGVLQIKTQLYDFLKNQGVEEIKSLNEKFDPNFHEVVGEVEVKDKESGIIIEEVKKGYKLNGKVIRPVKVKVVK